MASESEEDSRERFFDACSKSACAVFEKTKYDEIVDILRGQAPQHGTSLRKLRNVKARYIVRETNGVVELFRKEKAKARHRRIVHSEELFDIISSAQRDNQFSSAEGLHDYLFQRYCNISLEICSTYLRCLRNSISIGSSTIEIDREGYFSLIDMRKYAAGKYGEKWVLLYQDFPSQRIYARAQFCASVNATAEELLRIFISDGPPHRVYSNSKMKFNNRVVKRIAKIDSTFRIQVKRTHFLNQQFQNMVDFMSKLLVWINGNLSIGWTIGIYYCAAYLSNDPADLNSRTCYSRRSLIEAQAIMQEAAEEASVETNNSEGDRQDESSGRISIGLQETPVASSLECSGDPPSSSSVCVVEEAGTYECL